MFDELWFDPFLKTFETRRESKVSTKLPARKREKSRQHWTFRKAHAATLFGRQRKSLTRRAELEFKRSGIAFKSREISPGSK
jgi:hypothetical protein